MLKNSQRTKPECKYEIPDEYYSHITFCRKTKCQYYGMECRDDCKEREPVDEQ